MYIYLRKTAFTTDPSSPALAGLSSHILCLTYWIRLDLEYYCTQGQSLFFRVEYRAITLLLSTCNLARMGRRLSSLNLLFGIASAMAQYFKALINI